ncbi:MAG: undecaprenyl-phosphate glucose phosphotransferase [Bacteroidaceae bacterium]
MQSDKDNRLYYVVMIADMVMIVVLNLLLYILFKRLAPHTFPSIGFKLTTLILASSYLATFIIHPPVNQKRFNSAESVIKNVIFTGTLFAVITSLVITLFYPSMHFPRTYFFTYIIIYVLILMIERLVLRRLFMHFRANKRNQNLVVLIGNTNGIKELFHYISQPIYGYTVKAHFADEPSDDPELSELYAGTTNTLYEWLSKHKNINEIYGYVPSTEQEKINMLSKYCDNNLIRFFYVPDLNVFRGKLLFNQYGSTPVIARRREPLTYPQNKIVKRVFDIFFSLLVLIVVFPIVFLISAIIIKIQSPGPIFFRQLRTGLDGKSFYCLKFRSMHMNKDADRLQATKDDPRKFTYGNIMRKTNIDELPQFINVLLGDMSVVGPRPHMLKHTEEYSNIINRYMVRHLAKPGITGLAQVSGFRGETQKLSQMEDRVKKDIEYIENWTLLLDIRIIVKTVTNVFAGEKNAY